ncbi:hypothetical protein AMELA_G00183460 [Ameiurus melas]|uniref:Uncharacterized protein n=1 Tax=Ameiurus melas TaxID=219545 RepID=A0A7J6AD05_AMEME|nr:hypothetical protein AMELA_G00183460 [Ameiurus melas]
MNSAQILHQALSQISNAHSNGPNEDDDDDDIGDDDDIDDDDDDDIDDDIDGDDDINDDDDENEDEDEDDDYDDDEDDDEDDDDDDENEDEDDGNDDDDIDDDDDDDDDNDDDDENEDDDDDDDIGAICVVRARAKSSSLLVEADYKLARALHATHPSPPAVSSDQLRRPGSRTAEARRNILSLSLSLSSDIMASVLEKLMTSLNSGPAEPPTNKVTVVGVGQVGMAPPSASCRRTCVMSWHWSTCSRTS